MKGSQIGDENGTKEGHDAISTIAMTSLPKKMGASGGPMTPLIGANIPPMNKTVDQMLSTTHFPN